MSLNLLARCSVAAAAALSLTATASGCSLLPLAGRAAAPATDAAPSASPGAADPAETAAGQLPLVGTPVAQGDHGSLVRVDDGTNVVTLTGVRRISPDLGLVTVTMHAQDGPVAQAAGWDDPALSHSPYEVAEAAKRYDLSGVEVTAAGDPTVYQTAATADDECLCSRLPLTIAAGDTISAYAYVTLPPAATAVDVVVGPLGPWKDVPVS